MKNRKIIVTSVILSLITITSIASADFDCSTIDRDQIMTIMEKNKNGETLTTTEETLLTNVKSCLPEKGGERTGTGFMFREKTGTGFMIREKTGSGFIVGEKKGNGLNDISKKITNTRNNLSVAYKNKMDTAFKTILSNISSYSDEKKLTTLETLNTKITALKTKIADSSSYSDTKKATYSDIFSYLNDLINAEIDDLDGGEDDITDDIFSDLFN